MIFFGYFFGAGNKWILSIVSDWSNKSWFKCPKMDCGRCQPLRHCHGFFFHSGAFFVSSGHTIGINRATRIQCTPDTRAHAPVCAVCSTDWFFSQPMQRIRRLEELIEYGFIFWLRKSRENDVSVSHTTSWHWTMCSSIRRTLCADVAVSFRVAFRPSIHSAWVDFLPFPNWLYSLSWSSAVHSYACLYLFCSGLIFWPIQWVLFTYKYLLHIKHNNCARFGQRSHSSNGKSVENALADSDQCAEQTNRIGWMDTDSARNSTRSTWRAKAIAASPTIAQNPQVMHEQLCLLH